MTDAKNLILQYDDSTLIARFARTENQILFGVPHALNRAIIRLEKAEFAHVGASLQIRRKAFFFGTDAAPGGAAARVTIFAKVPNKNATVAPQGRLFAELALGQHKTTSDKNLVLTLIETGGLRRPFTPGAHDVAAPITGRPARPNFARGVPPEFTFQGLAFKGYFRGRAIKRHGGKRGLVDQTIFGEFGRVNRDQLLQRRVQWKGKNRTFILLHTKLAPEGGVFQRIGPDRGDIRMLYAFLKPFPLKQSIHWVNVAQSLGGEYLHEEIQTELVDIITHNVAKGVA